jgi:hypothetical protein
MNSDDAAAGNGRGGGPFDDQGSNRPVSPEQARFEGVRRELAANVAGYVRDLRDEGLPTKVVCLLASEYQTYWLRRLFVPMD